MQNQDLKIKEVCIEKWYHLFVFETNKTLQRLILKYW